MAERKPSIDVPGPRAINKIGDRVSELEHKDHVSDNQVLVLDAIRATGMGQDHDVGGIRRPNVEGHWSPSIPNRKRCEAWQSLRMVGLRSLMPVH
jgi:hypothetical protein